ncbi:peptidase M3 [candidate division GN15 bacterium]|uniref:Peptidase M3 n=1 Tax=candidate division GN15 bacterium TaxID=2072418 RepID=A0A855X4B2_9BACT|nr:MAG: peptidase M3 [candidate division GN15 bacterium]
MKSVATGFVLMMTFLAIACPTAGAADNDNQSAQVFLQEFEARVRPLSVAESQAFYDAVTSGDSAAYEKSTATALALQAVYTDPATFARIRAMREAGTVTDPRLKRMLDILYLGFLGNQTDTTLLRQLVERENALEQKFNTYRVRLGDRELNDNQVDSILRYSTNSAELEAVWKASREIGREILPQVQELTRLRNRIARALGFADFYDMQFKLGEQDPAEVLAIFDQLDSLTREPFATLKGQIDSALARRYGISIADLRPWHYQNRFFQEAPRIYEVNLDKFYEGKDPVAISREYFAGIGLPVDSIVAHSDLYERPGKYQHAQCVDIDRVGDVRVICNVRPDYYWMNTMLHELGHAVYDYYYDPSLPWLLHGAAHSLTTEAVANFFGRLASNPQWLTQMAGVPQDQVDKISPDCRRTLRLEQLVFSRWAQVVVRFERDMYANPDQDLNALWYRLVEKYQGLAPLAGRNEPDWAAKIHIALYPAYYHNYVLGELLASQFAATIGREVLNSNEPFNAGFTNDGRIGQFFIDKVFHPANSYRWDEMIERATGEKLTARYFARQFVEGK